MLVLIVAAYLLAIVTANLAVATYGPAALALTAWVLIPFDMTAKDALQERWTGNGLVLKLGGLILTGSLLSAALNLDAGRVALASFCAFGMGSALDAVVFHLLRGRPRLQRVNASNIASAVTDSILFQLVAFGGVDLAVFASQSLSKLVGGAVWSLLLTVTIWRWIQKEPR